MMTRKFRGKPVLEEVNRHCDEGFLNELAKVLLLLLLPR